LSKFHNSFLYYSFSKIYDDYIGIIIYNCETIKIEIKMKKLLYTLFAASIIFTSCEKEEEEQDQEVSSASIVGVWSATSMNFEISTSIEMGGFTLEEDTNYTVLPTDDEWDLEGDLEFTADGKAIENGDTVSYTYVGNELTIYEEGEEEEQVYQCTVTSTNLEMVSEESMVEEEDGIIMNTSYKVTINAVRQ